jgi:transcriptional regulator with XRE-family HTH domain
MATIGATARCRVATSIKATRAARGMSQAALAHAIGRSQTAVSYWEGGTRSPGVDDLAVLAAVLGCTIGDLADDPDAHHPGQGHRLHEIGVLRSRAEVLVTEADRAWREIAALARICDRMHAENTELRAENERLKAGAP